MNSDQTGLPLAVRRSIEQSGDPPDWAEQWLARGGEAFMPYEQYARPRRNALTISGGTSRSEGGQIVLPHFALQRLAICRTCPHSTSSFESGCDLLGPNCSSCYRRRPGTVCPDEPPRWGPLELESIQRSARHFQ